MLGDCSEILGEDREAAVCRELTKRFEEVTRGTLGDLATQVSAGGHGQGELVVADRARIGPRGTTRTLSARLWSRPWHACGLWMRPRRSPGRWACRGGRSIRLRLGWRKVRDNHGSRDEGADGDATAPWRNGPSRRTSAEEMVAGDYARPWPVRGAAALARCGRRDRPDRARGRVRGVHRGQEGAQFRCGGIASGAPSDRSVVDAAAEEFPPANRRDRTPMCGSIWRWSTGAAESQVIENAFAA